MSFLGKMLKNKVMRSAASKAGLEKEYSTYKSFERARNMGRKVTNVLRAKPTQAASAAVKRSETIEIQGKDFNRMTAKVREETAERVGSASIKTEAEEKKEAAQKAVRYSSNIALREMLESEMKFEERGVNSMGFPVSKKGLNDVKGLSVDFDKGVYPKVMVMTELVVENKKGLIEKQPLKYNFLGKLHRNKYTGPVLQKISSLI